MGRHHSKLSRKPGLLPETLQDQQPTAGKEGITKREALKQFGTFLPGFGVILFVVGLGYWIYLVTYCDGPARFSSVNAYYSCRATFRANNWTFPDSQTRCRYSSP